MIKKNGYVAGDCFTYASVDRALLGGIGAECIWVDNQGARYGEHSWILMFYADRFTGAGLY